MKALYFGQTLSIINLCEIIRRSRASNSRANRPMWSEIEISIKTEGAVRWTIFFPIKSLWELLVAMENSVDPICTETLCRFSPIQIMLHIKFDHLSVS